MKNVILLLSLISFKSYSQSEWVEYFPNNAFFSFKFPSSATELSDTLDFFAADYLSSDSILLTCHFIKQDSSFLSILNSTDPEDSIVYSELDSLTNPLVSIRLALLNQSDLTTEFLLIDTLWENGAIKVREIGLNFITDDGISKVLFMKILYNGYDIALFGASAEIQKQSNMLNLKDEFYNSITLK